jgi:hypothetical protein
VIEIPLSDVFLAGLVFFYSLNLGPMMFESLTSDRTWASNPPESFHMFVGPYGQKTAHDWRIVSPLALLSFILALVFNWQVEGRSVWLGGAFVVYLLVHAATAAYFVPEQERLISQSGALAPHLLKSRADRWIFLNYFRNVAGVAAFVLLLRAVLVARLQ